MKLLITAIFIAGYLQIPTIIVPQYKMEKLIERLEAKATARVPKFTTITRRSARVIYHIEGGQRLGYWGAIVIIHWDGGQAMEMDELEYDNGLYEYIDPFEKRD